MVWPEIDLIDRHAPVSESRVHPVGKGMALLFRKEASSDAGLIGHDEDHHPSPDGRSAKVKNAVDKMEILGPVDVMPVFVNDPVSIEEQSSLHV
jgi:hypothetical protein